MMDLDRVNAYMARVEESETKTFQPVGSKLKVGPGPWHGLYRYGRPG